MNPLEDRLHEYLSQFDDEPMLALSSRRVAALDPLPQSKKKHIIRGDVPMNTPTPPSRTRVRLYSHVTKTRFLHVEDALSLGKVRLFAGTYSRGQGMSGHTSHYLDLADARIVFHALLHGEQGFTYKEYKGTPSSSPTQAAVSRVLSVAVKGDNVYIELKSGPGQLTPTGAITPNGRAETEVNVSFKVHEARRLAAEVLAYIHAWDVCRLISFPEAIGKPPAYRFSPEAGEPDNSALVAVNTGDEEVQTDSSCLPPSVFGAARPLTRKSNGVTAQTVPQPSWSGKTASSHKVSRDLSYGDGVILGGDNVLEAQTFQRYLAENGQPPATKAVLQAYYRQQTAA